MSYLYGDSTHSDLTSNFLEVLRDAIDFSVFVLQADEKIKEGKAKAAMLNEEAAAEIGRLERFSTAVAAAIDGAQKGTDGSPTSHLAARVSELLAGAGRQSADAVRAKVATDIAAIDAEEASARAACHEALSAFLGPHTTTEPSAQRIALLDTGHYDATLAGAGTFGIEWTFELAIPEGNLWASQVRIERINPQLEIKTPQVTGWISKEIKVRPQRIERHAVTELVTLDGKTQYKLRIEAPIETGFDVEVVGDVVQEGGAHKTPTVKMTRIGPPDDAAVGPFEVDAADVPILIELTGKLTAAAAELPRAKLSLANVVDDAGSGASDFRAMPTFVPIVERLMSTLAPVVREIARRSLTPTELVLRRALADNRREEVFVTKATLREKYAPLPAPLRALFSPLGFDGPAATPAPAPVAPTVVAQTPPPRAEIRRSQPPPSLEAPAPPASKTGPLPPVTPPPRPKASVPPPGPPPPAPPPAAPDSSSGKNEKFVEAVKKIVLVLKDGRTDEGYAQYAELLSSPGFTQYRADDQRQALKLLLLAKAPPSRSEPVLRAYRIALTRIQALVDAAAEPADYEMLGVAHLQLDDKSSAGAAFDIALKLERARNPTSELSMNLARRISQLA